MLFVTFMQLSVGVALPLVFAIRRESTAAVEFARQHRIPPHNQRLRAYSWLHKATSLEGRPTTALAAALMGAYTVWAAATWYRLSSQ